MVAILLSPKVDSSAGERDIGGLLAGPTGPSVEPTKDRVQRRFRNLKPSVLHGLRCVMGARLLTGFLTLFLAFLLREQPISNLDSTLLLGIVIAAAGVGNSLGTVAGNVLKNKPPEKIGLTVLCIDAAMAIVTAVFSSIFTVVALGLVAGLCAQLAKLSYDAVVQRDVAEVVRTRSSPLGDGVPDLLGVRRRSRYQPATHPPAGLRTGRPAALRPADLDDHRLAQGAAAREAPRSAQPADTPDSRHPREPPQDEWRGPQRAEQPREPS